MTTNMSFRIIFRFFFVLFSIKFMHDAFYKWDGFLYYTTFKDSLYYLSMAFILWTFVGACFSLILWIVVYLLHKAILRTIVPVHLEHITFYFMLVLLVLFIKWGFFDQISVSDITGLSRNVALMAGGLFATIIAWLTYKHSSKILNEVYFRMTPLFWIFAFLLIVAVPFSFNIFKKEDSPVQRIAAGSEASQQERPNIILVTLDSLTAIDMSVFGYERPTTPFLNEWAKYAVKFTRTYSTASWTAPSIMSLLTGNYPWTHKVWHETKSNPINNYEKSLPAVLGDYGYSASAFVQNDQCHPNALGLGSSFKQMDESYTFWSLSTDGYLWPMLSISHFVYKITKNHLVAIWISMHPVFERLLNFLSSDYADQNMSPPEKVYNRFLDYISKNQKQPFFAWLHIFPPHNDYLPGKKYAATFGDPGKFTSANEQRPYINRDYSSDQQANVDIIRKRYNEFIMYSDEKFKDFITELSATIDMSNTIIIFSADHGEMFKHNYMAHNGPHLYEPLVNIPLIIKMPDKQGGKTVDVPVSQIDVAPTILEMVDIPVPDWMEGRSLLPLMNDMQLDMRPVYSMQLIENRAIGINPITKGTISVWDGDYKLVHYLDDNKSLLFNIKADPDETQNILNKDPEIAGKLMKLINDNISRANKRIELSQ